METFKLRIMFAFLALSTARGFSLSGVHSSSIGKRSISNSSSRLSMGFLDFLGLGEKKFDEPCVMGEESIMAPKKHGTSDTPVQGNLRWGCDVKVADNICNFNRHYAEYRGYWRSTSFIEQAKVEYEQNGEVKFYDSNTGKLLFIAPKGRSFEEFIKESLSHGWPSFRDEEVVWDDVRCLSNGEAVSLAGTHLGHNLPDFSGNRYCINLVSVAGNPTTPAQE
mmetsp:Transcript_1726/g.2476  ORF Transcript_1726/g.2476 Transcript_1726/m.2476 type:complete len:222 (+) Transcript_1726:33-698(+)